MLCLYSFHWRFFWVWESSLLWHVGWMLIAPRVDIRNSLGDEGGWCGEVIWISFRYRFLGLTGSWSISTPLNMLDIVLNAILHHFKDYICYFSAHLKYALVRHFNLILSVAIHKCFCYCWFSRTIHYIFLGLLNKFFPLSLNVPIWNFWWSSYFFRMQHKIMGPLLNKPL